MNWMYKFRKDISNYSVVVLDRVLWIGGQIWSLRVNSEYLGRVQVDQWQDMNMQFSSSRWLQKASKIFPGKGWFKTEHIIHDLEKFINKYYYFFRPRQTIRWWRNCCQFRGNSWRSILSSGKKEFWLISSFSPASFPSPQSPISCQSVLQERGKRWRAWWWWWVFEIQHSGESKAGQTTKWGALRKWAFWPLFVRTNWCLAFRIIPLHMTNNP